MSDLARRSSNQFYAMHVATGKIVYPDHQAAPQTAPKLGKRSRSAVA